MYQMNVKQIPKLPPWHIKSAPKYDYKASGRPESYPLTWRRFFQLFVAHFHLSLAATMEIYLPRLSTCQKMKACKKLPHFVIKRAHHKHSAQLIKNFGQSEGLFVRLGLSVVINQ
jgi:hypothetical protein